MGKKTLDECKTGRDFVHYVEHDSRTVSIRQCGSHVYATGPTGKGGPIPDHGNKQLPTGTRKSVIKMLIAAGLAVLVTIACVAGPLSTAIIK